jgi:hypothetical protein
MKNLHKLLKGEHILGLTNVHFEKDRVCSVSESKSPAGWRSAPALNPEMRRGLGVLLDRWNEREELKNTQGFRVVRAAGA